MEPQAAIATGANLLAGLLRNIGILLSFSPVAHMSSLVKPPSFRRMRSRERREEPRRGLLLLSLIFIAVLVYARWVEPARLVVRRVDVPVADLAPELAGFRILVASDLHARWFGPGQGRIKAALDRLARANPDGRAFDAAVFAGDLIDAHRPDPEPGQALLSLFAARAPTYFALGNHDGPYLNLVLPAVRHSGATILGWKAGATPRAGPSPAPSPLGVVFVGSDWWAPAPEDLAARVRAARGLPGPGGRPPFVVVAVHSPAPALTRAAGEAGAALVVAGHDHGGQVAVPVIGPVWTPTRGWFPSRADGLFRVGGTPQYVTAGLGTSALPVRLCVPPSLTVLRLVPSERPAWPRWSRYPQVGTSSPQTP